MSRKIDTRAIGLDAGLSLVRWLTGAEHLHYGLWEGLEPGVPNLRAAQEAYTDRVLSLLPEGRLRILDVGGGAGETARRLLSLGHEVEIVVPSALLAERCRENAPGARLHEMRFQDFEGSQPFDVCLFSESFQYIPLAEGLPHASALLRPGGHVILADCFRSETFPGSPHDTVGGGHLIGAFRDALADSPFEVVSEDDVTRLVAPSVEIEQEFFNVLGRAWSRIERELSQHRPILRRTLSGIWSMLVSRRRRERLARRFLERHRTADVFADKNRYLMMKLRLTA